MMKKIYSLFFYILTKEKVKKRVENKESKNSSISFEPLKLLLNLWKDKKQPDELKY